MTKYAQAVITQTESGNWKMFIQSDRQVERSIVGTLDDILKELRDASGREWERRSPDYEERIREALHVKWWLTEGRGR